VALKSTGRSLARLFLVIQEELLAVHGTHPFGAQVHSLNWGANFDGLLQLSALSYMSVSIACPFAA
jgi:hypothetical protein